MFLTLGNLGQGVADVINVREQDASGRDHSTR
jgi:hypothetical protein